MSTETCTLIPSRSGCAASECDADAHRHALHDLDPVAGRVLRRDQRELRAGGGADALHLARQLEAGIGVDLDRRPAGRGHAVELGFLEVGLDPAVVGFARCLRPAPGRHVLADVQAVDLADHARDGRGDRRSGPGARGRLVPRARAARTAGKSSVCDVRVAAERGGGRQNALARQVHVAFRGAQRVISPRPARRPRSTPRSASDSGGRTRCWRTSRIDLRRVELGLGRLVGGAQLLHRQPRRGQCRVGLVQRDAVGLGVDAEQRRRLPRRGRSRPRRPRRSGRRRRTRWRRSAGGHRRCRC